MSWSRFVLPLLLLVSGSLRAAAPDLLREAARDNPRAVFLQGIEAYKASDHDKAVRCFEALSAFYDSPVVAYDLGNARYQRGELGKAVVAWKRALLLDPGNQDAAHNLRVVTGASPWGEGLSGRLRQFYLGFTLEGLERVSLLLLTLSVLGFALFRVTGRRSGQVVSVLGLAGALLVGAWAYSRAARWVVGREAVIVGQGAVVATAGPGFPGEYPKVFTVHPGQVVTVHRSSGPFRQISLPTGAAGWVPVERHEEL